jgi:hypothetical protein
LGAREWKPGWAMMTAACAVEVEEQREGMESERDYEGFDYP